MEPADNNRSVKTIGQHGDFSPACVLALESEFSILKTNIQSVRVCYKVSMINISHIDLVIPTKEQLTLVVDVRDLASNMQMQDAAYQLDNYHSKHLTKR